MKRCCCCEATGCQPPSVLNNDRQCYETGGCCTSLSSPHRAPPRGPTPSKEVVIIAACYSKVSAPSLCPNATQSLLGIRGLAGGAAGRRIMAALAQASAAPGDAPAPPATSKTTAPSYLSPRKTDRLLQPTWKTAAGRPGFLPGGRGGVKTGAAAALMRRLLVGFGSRPLAADAALWATRVVVAAGRVPPPGAPLPRQSCGWAENWSRGGAPCPSLVAGAGGVSSCVSCAQGGAAADCSVCVGGGGQLGTPRTLSIPVQAIKCREGGPVRVLPPPPGTRLGGSRRGWGVVLSGGRAAWGCRVPWQRRQRQTLTGCQTACRAPP